VINVFQPTTDSAEAFQVGNTLASNWLGKGQKVDEFEAAWAKHIGVDPAHVVSTNSATEGLFQICQNIGLNSGDLVIMPSISFVGARNAVLATDATPVYCDVDPHTLNPTLAHIQAAWRKHTQALILLHYGGCTQELDSIRQWCSDTDMIMIEDAACSQATMYRGKHAGTWGHYGVWSFDAMKMLTCGDGGMIYCEDERDATDLKQQMYLGLNEQSGLSSDKDKWWQYSVVGCGRRSIMNDIAAGIGLAQLSKAHEFVERRKTIAQYYDECLAGCVKVCPGDPYYFYWVQTDKRDGLAQHLRSRGVYTTFRYYPLHWVDRTGQQLPGTEYAANSTLLLPLHNGLSDEDVNQVVDRVKEFFNDRSPNSRSKELTEIEGVITETVKEKGLQPGTWIIGPSVEGHK